MRPRSGESQIEYPHRRVIPRRRPRTNPRPRVARPADTSAASARARADLDLFIAKFTPEIAAPARSAIAWMRRRLPGAVELVYDNFYALVIGYAPTEKPSSALFSIVIRPRHISLCFLHGVTLARAGGDPKKLLQGQGNQVRNIRLADAKTLTSPDVQALIDNAIALSPEPFVPSRGISTIVRLKAARQFPRRPGAPR